MWWGGWGREGGGGVGVVGGGGGGGFQGRCYSAAITSVMHHTEIGEIWPWFHCHAVCMNVISGS